MNANENTTNENVVNETPKPKTPNYKNPSDIFDISNTKEAYRTWYDRPSTDDLSKAYFRAAILLRKANVDLDSDAEATINFILRKRATREQSKISTGESRIEKLKKLDAKEIEKRIETQQKKLEALLKAKDAKSA
jgi:hypothetical protein